MLVGLLMGVAAAKCGVAGAADPVLGALARPYRHADVVPRA